MAPPPDVYFPSLDSCFSGDNQLISWKSAFRRLVNAKTDVEETDSLYKFLTCPESLQIISNPFNPFAAPNEQSKSDFQSKTAAIHVPTVSTGTWNLDEIKNDAKWLSNKTQIDHISALRIVVCERQNRPGDELLSELSEEETTSLQDAIGLGNLSHSTSAAQAAEILNYKGETNFELSGFSGDEVRHLKLFRLYLSEKQHILKISQRIFCVALRRISPGGHHMDAKISRVEHAQTKLEELGKSIFGIQSGKGLNAISIKQCLEAVRTRICNLETGSGWLLPEEPNVEIELIWQTNVLEELNQILQFLVLQLQLSKTIPSAELFLSWLRLMADYDFLEMLRPATEEQQVILGPLHALIAIATLAFVRLRESTSYFETASYLSPTPEPTISEAPFFMSRENIGEINEICLKAANAGCLTAAPMIFAFGMVMFAVREIAFCTKEERELQQAQHAVDSFNSNAPSSSPSRAAEQSIFEDIFEKARNPAFDDDFVKLLVTSSVDKCHVFDFISALVESLRPISGAGDGGMLSCWVRVELLDLIRASVEHLDYIPEVVSSVLCVISGPTDDCNQISSTERSDACDPRSIFIQDPVLVDRIFRVAKSRFPYEAMNFLKLCRALSGSSVVDDDGLPYIAQELESMETYTQVVAPGFQGYQPIREDENANFVSLIQPLPMQETAMSESPTEYESTSNIVVLAESCVIPQEALGQVVNESKPAVIMWHHEYNCLGFLGIWLEQATNSRRSDQIPDDEIIAEIVGLFADLITSAQINSKRNGTDSVAKRILEMASDGLNRHGDIISVIFEIFERNLQNTISKRGSSRNLQPVISSLRFINALIAVIPGRVWPFLSRSSFIGSDGKGGMLVTIVSSIEAVSGDFSFLQAAVQMFDLLVDDVINHSGVRRSAGRVSAKSNHLTEFSAGIPPYIMRSFLLALVRVMVEAYNNNTTWRYNDICQQLKINTSLALTIDKILYSIYAIDDTSDLDSKLVGVFSSSAAYILNVLRPTTVEELPFNPLLRTILSGLQYSRSSSGLRNLLLHASHIQSALTLSERLAQAGRLIGSPMSMLENQLFKASPVLIRLYALSYDYQLPVVSLLELLISYAATDSNREPPSVLGHLGAKSSSNFLHCLSKFDRPFKNPALYVSIWDLLSTVISKRQQWLAVFFLTGSSARDSLKMGDKGSSSTMIGQPFLGISLDLLAKIDTVQPQIAISALNFVARAQEHWLWATPQIKSHSEFFPNIVNFVTSSEIRKCPPLDQCLNAKIASLVADICAVYLHSAKESRDLTFFKTIIPLISWFSDNAVVVEGYNASLHSNLRKNFEMKYSGCKVVSMKRTGLTRPELGENYFYDVELGSKLFGYDFAWNGTRDQGFVEEVKRANLNLSLVEAQMNLLQSWKFLAIEHCADFMLDREIQKSMARVVRSCLVSNSKTVPDEKVFYKVQQIHAEFALALLQRLNDAGSRGAEVFGLLSVAWDATRFRNPSYETALLNGDTEYYGVMLNILFLALQFHVAGPSRSVPEAVSKKPEVSSDLSIVLEIVKVIVAQGFRSLTTYLHDEPEKCSPRDFAILTAILQTCLRVKNSDRIYEQAAFHLADSDTPRYAATLFSWAYQLTVEGDPVYGELSVLFLLELSCIPMMAEQMAADGILVKLSTFRLTDVLRQPHGCGPFDPIPRLFAIWNSGFLPLCLNLLYSVVRAAPEVAAFLNQFEGQLRRASASFSFGQPTTTSPLASSHLKSSQHVKKLSLSMATEACSLALISQIINKFRDAGASTGVDAQNIQELNWDGTQVKDDIESLLEKRSVLRSRIVATNEKELEMSRREPLDRSTGCQNQLEEKIVKELQMTVMCLAGREAV
ncbi:nucleoporin [Histoplasma capsulatum var. duboisii H88]|uniref:Nucleoporin n=1 Tax=Ajellomyces capsulatus (strain H88) TaxID=544711 RepID=F0UMF7_AJEC8|nr:nucleoporin [Histoplasma capsulatum var. duboisii H88]QSS53473.1 nucleoporin [Histoplasma capsulatum var. duboisii H88]